MSLLTAILALFSPAKAQEVHYASFTANNPAIDLSRMIAAIQATENTPRNVIGAAFERSEFQITPDVWREHTTAPFDWASRSDPKCVAETRFVMEKHLIKIIMFISDVRGYSMTPYTVACIYKGGMRRWYENRLRPQDLDYAHRCANLYADSQ